MLNNFIEDKNILGIIFFSYILGIVNFPGNHQENLFSILKDRNNITCLLFHFSYHFFILIFINDKNFNIIKNKRFK